MEAEKPRDPRVSRRQKQQAAGPLDITCLMPLMNIVAISLSDNAAVSANLVNIFPIGFNISSYQ